MKQKIHFIMTTFQEYKRKISISEVAESLGYKLNAKAGRKYLEYKLYSGNTKVDEILIYNNGGNQTYFSRFGVGDKGDLINFVMNRLSSFTCSGSGYDAVREVLSKYSKDVAVVTRQKVVLPNIETKFNIDDYEISVNEKVLYEYLNDIRKISIDTINAFIKIGAVKTVCNRTNPYKILNVAFPFCSILNPEDILNFELRNYNSRQGRSFKGFCPGGNKANAVWVASFASDRGKVKNVYIGESALDMMALYQILDDGEKKDGAFISVGGNLVYSQIKDLKLAFPNADIILCFDDDTQGNIYDVMAAYFLVKGLEPKVYRNANDVIISLYNDVVVLRSSIDKFVSLNYLLGVDLLPNWLQIKKAHGAKDFNDILLK